MSNNNEFGRYIRKVRKARNYTLKQVGQAVSKSAQYIWDLENGKKGKNISPALVAGITSFLDIPIASLYNLTKIGANQDFSDKRYLNYLKMTRNKGQASRIRHAMDGIITSSDEIANEAKGIVVLGDKIQKLKDFVRELDTAISAG